MQTFLPYPSFIQSAKCLDYRRLGKQRVECSQILKVLLNESKGNAWKNHPAVLMWKGYELALAYYGFAICQEWISRKYRDSLQPKFKYYINLLLDKGNKFNMPLFLGNIEFHASHRSNLLRKKPEYYKQFNWSEPDNLPYVWPTKENV